jgi:hypothetical protein
LAPQKREYYREYDRMNESRVETGLTRSKNPTGTGRKGKKKTRAEREEERSAHDEIVPGENETHSLGDETVYQEEDQSVEKNSHLTCFSVHERNF